MSQPSSTNTRDLLFRIDQIPAFAGMGVIIIRNERAVVIREPLLCKAGPNYIVIEGMSGPPPAPQISSRGVVVEGGLAALNCSAAVVAGLVTFGSAAASPLTGGSSLLVTGVAYTATAATGVSCGVALMRTYNEIADPQANVALDKQQWYKRSMMVVDGVSLVGVGVSAVAAARLMSILSRSGVKLRLAAGGSVPSHLRKRLADIMTRLKNPGASNRSIKEMVRSGAAPGRLTNTEISTATLHQLKDAVAAGLSFGASGLDGNIRSWTVYLLETRDATGTGVR